MNTPSTIHSRARDFRHAAAAALRGKWGIAVLAALLASILGAGGTYPTFNFNIDLDTLKENLPPLTGGEMSIIGGADAPTLQMILTKLAPMLATVGIAAVVSGLLVGLAFFMLGSCVSIGHARFRLSILDGNTPSVGVLFSGFGDVLWKSFGMNILINLYVWLWSLPALFLLIAGSACAIVGIATSEYTAAQLMASASSSAPIVAAFALLFVVLLFLPTVAAYRYKMAHYVLAENPAMSATEAIRESKRMMQGNKWRLFCLELSFIGWGLLATLTCGIGYIWLLPYMQQAEAAFYHEISGRAAIREAVEQLSELSADL